MQKCKWNLNSMRNFMFCRSEKEDGTLKLWNDIKTSLLNKDVHTFIYYSTAKWFIIRFICDLKTFTFAEWNCQFVGFRDDCDSPKGVRLVNCVCSFALIISKPGRDEKIAPLFETELCTELLFSWGNHKIYFGNESSFLFYLCSRIFEHKMCLRKYLIKFIFANYLLFSQWKKNLI